jgi:hypothetical protein
MRRWLLLGGLVACATPAPVPDRDGDRGPEPVDTAALDPATPSSTAPTETTPETPGPAVPLELCINEIMASNTISWVDESGAHADWVELHNPGEVDVALKDWYLSDDAEDPWKDPLPADLVVPARGFLVFAADGAEELGPLHLPFSLAEEGDTVALFRWDGSGEIIHYGPLTEDLAIARSPDCCPDVATCAQLVWVGSPGVSNVPPILVEEEALPKLSTWRWRSDPTEPPIDWMAVAFDDSAWPEGAGYLGYGDYHIVTVLPYGYDAANKWLTNQFRTTFELADAAGVTSVRLEVARDDGVVVYLNGMEVLRSNLPADPLTATTLASSAMGGAQETGYTGFEIDLALLVEGTNTLAAQVHQAAPDSSDLTFDLSVHVEREVPGIP